MRIEKPQSNNGYYYHRLNYSAKRLDGFLLLQTRRSIPFLSEVFFLFDKRWRLTFIPVGSNFNQLLYKPIYI